jgi:hypothetical protein
VRRITTDPARVAAWVAARCDVAQFSPPYSCIGWEDANGNLVGGAVFNSFTGANIEVSLAGRGALCRQAIRDMVWYTFKMLGVRRVTAHTKSQNVRLINQAIRGGWLNEGFRRRWFHDDDAVALVLFPENCRWLDAVSSQDPSN